MSTTDDGNDPEVLRYSYKPSLAGAPSEFALGADELEMRGGRHSLRVPYGDVRFVRLAFRPVTMLNYRFVTEIWAKSGAKMTIASASWRSMIEFTRQDDSYKAFIVELHRRVAASGAPTAFRAGAPALLYWPGLAIFSGLMVATVVLAFRAVQQGEWRGAAIVLAMLGFFLWQAGAFFRRNRPSAYLPERLPSQVLP